MLSMTADTLGFSSGCVMEVSGDGIRVFLVSGGRTGRICARLFFRLVQAAAAKPFLDLTVSLFLIQKTAEAISEFRFIGTTDLFREHLFPEQGKITDPKGFCCRFPGNWIPWKKIFVIPKVSASEPETKNIKTMLRQWKQFLRFSPSGNFFYSAEEDDEFVYISSNMLALLGYTKRRILL